MLRAFLDVKLPADLASLVLSHARAGTYARAGDPFVAGRTCFSLAVDGTCVYERRARMGAAGGKLMQAYYTATFAGTYSVRGDVLALHLDRLVRVAHGLRRLGKHSSVRGCTHCPCGTSEGGRPWFLAAPTAAAVRSVPSEPLGPRDAGERVAYVEALKTLPFDVRLPCSELWEQWQLPATGRYCPCPRAIGAYQESKLPPAERAARDAAKRQHAEYVAWSSEHFQWLPPPDAPKAERGGTCAQARAANFLDRTGAAFGDATTAGTAEDSGAVLRGALLASGFSSDDIEQTLATAAHGDLNVAAELMLSR